MENMGCKHRKVTPYWPRANGEAERFMQNLAKVATTSQVEGKCWKQELYKYLRNYRLAPHSSTGMPPATIMFNRTIRGTIPCIQDDEPGLHDKVVRENDERAKLKMAGKVKVGDKVLLKQRKVNKFTPKYDPKEYQVVKVKGSMVTARRGDRDVTRNESLFKKYDGDQIYGESQVEPPISVVKPTSVRHPMTTAAQPKPAAVNTSTPPTPAVPPTPVRNAITPQTATPRAPRISPIPRTAMSPVRKRLSLDIPPTPAKQATASIPTRRSNRDIKPPKRFSEFVMD